MLFLSYQDLALGDQLAGSRELKAPVRTCHADVYFSKGRSSAGSFHRGLESYGEVDGAGKRRCVSEDKPGRIPRTVQ